MANEQNLKKFSSEYQPEKNGRPKGSRNRATIVRQWLEIMRETTNPLTGKKDKMEIQDEMVLKQIEKSLEGDTAAFKELMDSAHGKAVQSFEHSGKDGEPLRVIFQNMNESPEC
jgi:hypothetical protein